MLEVQKQLDIILSIAEKANDEIILVRLAICELNVLERQGYSQELDTKYRELLTKAEIIQDDRTVCLIDLDDFKQFNDTYGHDVGDNVLIAFSKACKMSMRDTYEDGTAGSYFR